MMFQQTSREDALRLFMTCRNNEGAVLPANTVAQWQTGTTVATNGNNIRQPDTGEMAAFAGVVDAAINIADFGLVQLSGFRNELLCFLDGTTPAIGTALFVTAGVGHVTPAAPSATNWPNFIGVTLQLIPAGGAPGLIKAMLRTL
jgi:hypothetical protein